MDQIINKYYFLSFINKVLSMQIMITDFMITAHKYFAQVSANHESFAFIFFFVFNLFFLNDQVGGLTLAFSQI